LKRPKPFSYYFNDKIRTLTMRMMALVTRRSKEERLDFGKERIERILLVRATFRLGDSLLATPAIFLFRRNFPSPTSPIHDQLKKFPAGKWLDCNG
jgi:hypothetical protein